MSAESFIYGVTKINCTTCGKDCLSNVYWRGMIDGKLVFKCSNCKGKERKAKKRRKKSKNNG